MLFKEVVGQQEVKQKLIGSVLSNKVAHTQLFIGPEGNGGLALALAFAQFILCENKQQNDSCGVCAVCMKVQKMIHADVHFSYPTFKVKAGSENPALSSDFIKEWREAVIENPYRNVTDWLDFINAENKQGNISAAECREIIRKLNFKTFEAKNKILILWMTEYLEKEGNILLKLLEEPPDDTILILVAENRDRILSTILSRCQMVSIPLVNDFDLLDALMNKHGLTREEANKIVRQAEGNYNESLSILNKEENNFQAPFNKWMRILFKQDAVELLKWIDDISRTGREKQKFFFRYALEFIRECVLLQQSGEEKSKLLDEEKRLAIWLAKQMSPEDWENIMQQFSEAHYYIERNAHAKMLFMNLSLHLQKIITSKKLSLA